MECPQCKAKVPVDARFCASCGHELVVVGDQRRVATVLFADLVGFTALSETLDPEQVKGMVDRCFERFAVDIESFGGRVDKVVGDAIVALFGAPIAHEDDAERAVRAGLRMQETIASITDEAGQAVQMRVGINTGEVLVGAVRAGREYTAMGDVVNTASRLQEAADPGTVLVGPGTWAATSGVIEYADIDPVEAKGKRLPVEAKQAVRANVPPGQRSRSVSTPLVGRESELALLVNVATTAIERSRAALLLIHGEAGMGKSRLASETASYATDELDALVLEGRCVPYGEANVWWPVAEAVRNAIGVGSTTDHDELDAALRRATETALNASGRIDEIDRVVAGLHHLLGHEGSLRDIDATRAREEAIRSVVALAEGYARRKPVLVVLSDLHWADQEVLDLLDTLVARLARQPFVILATARRHLQGTWRPSAEAANSVVLHLDPLDDESSRRLLHHLTEGAVHPSMASMLVSRAGGNPFYLEELVSLVSETGVHTVDQLLETEAGELPSTLRGLVAARLDALGPLDRQVLDDAAVLGRRNKVEALQKMAEVKRRIDPERARAVVEGLAAREFLVLDGSTYSFRSDVIREVAYSTLTKADRARSHAGLAHWIETHEDVEADYIIDQVANHWAASASLVADIGPIVDVPADVSDRAVSWLQRAIDTAEQAFLLQTVRDLADRALSLMSHDHPARHHVLARRAKARVGLYDLDAAMQDAADALRLAADRGDEESQAEALLIQAEVFQNQGDLAQSMRLAAHAEERYAALGDDAGRAGALRHQGLVHLFTGSFEDADGFLTEALELYRQTGGRRGEAWTLQNLSWSAYIAGRVEEAEARLEIAMATFEDLGDPGGLTWSRGLLAWVRFHQGHEDEAERLALEVEQDAKERGELWGEGMMVVLQASIALWTGRTEDAVAHAARAREIFGPIDDPFGTTQARVVLGRALVLSGAIEEGLRTFQLGGGRDDGVLMDSIGTLAASVNIGDVERAAGVLDLWAEIEAPDGFGGPDRLANVALHRLQAGDVESALAGLEEAVQRGFGEAGFVLAVRALAAALAGDPARATRCADHLAAVRHTYLDATQAEIGRAIALVDQDRTGEAREALVRRRDAVDRTGDRVAQAVVRLALALVAEYAGDDDAARLRDGAEDRLLALGTRAEGWRTLLGLRLGASATR